RALRGGAGPGRGRAADHPQPAADHALGRRPARAEQPEQLCRPGRWAGVGQEWRARRAWRGGPSPGRRHQAFLPVLPLLRLRRDGGRGGARVLGVLQPAGVLGLPQQQPPAGVLGLPQHQPPAGVLGLPQHLPEPARGVPRLCAARGAGASSSGGVSWTAPSAAVRTV
ncbi:unnamed protein product, partial [Prorocentrum cordatum]